MTLSRRFPLLALLVLAPFLSAAQPPQDLATVTAAVLRGRISGVTPTLRLEGGTWRAPDQLACFYERRGFVPAWSDGQGLRTSAADLLTALDAAGDDGLRPADYRTDALRRFLRQVQGHPAPGDLAEADLLLTDAFLTFGAHLRNGKVNPQTLYSDCGLAAADAVDLADLLEKGLASGRIRPALGELAPPHPEYQRLRDALRRYRTVAARVVGPLVPSGPTLRPGDRDPRIGALRTRLTADAEADGAPAVSPAAGEPDVFDPLLEKAVQAFQERHGLTADGVAGPATLGELNQSPEDHVREIAINLERWRWMPRDLGERHVLINIAGFRLEAVDEGRRALDMRVIVGKPYTRTPMFSSEMKSVVLNPSWYVPASIATKELFPKARKDASYFQRNGYEVLPGNRIRQRPGAGNALGRIKFLFPNRFGVYLHDTPSRGLFGQTVRTFSHGCIRIEKPFDLAVWALRDDAKWTLETLEAALGTGRERSIPLSSRIAVHVAYWTAWVDDAGVLQVGRDVYGRDAELGKRLGL